jgi:hypothetical protein
MILLSLLLAASVADAQRRFGLGVCGPADPVYIRTASETLWAVSSDGDGDR